MSTRVELPPAAAPARRRAAPWLGLAGLLLVGLAAFSCLLAVGCDAELKDAYGKRGALGSGSVNGTGVLAEMFRAAGHRVGTWPLLSPRLRQRADAIVWFPDDFETPPADVRKWLEEWLEAEAGRTLIYVGRDFDGAVFYWEKMRAGAPAGQRAGVGRRLSEAVLKFQSSRGRGPQPPQAGWFSVDTTKKPRMVRSLAGEPEWLAGVDASRVEIKLESRFLPPADGATRVVLHGGGEALVTRRQVGESRLIVVTNGSFLLNLPLVNREHRKLAGSLIREIGPERNVMFLESGGAPAIRDSDPTFSLPTGVELFSEPPFTTIMLHLAVLGLAFCLSRLPVFGLPREPQRPSTSDFGEHVWAMGELLSRTGDERYAAERLRQYQQTVRE